MKRSVFSLLLALAIAAPAAAASTAPPQLGRDLTGAGSGLLDLGRLSQSSELSFYYGGGSGLGNDYGGLYLSHFTYRLGSPLTLSLSLGARFDNAFSTGNGQPFVGGFQLAYHPSQSFLIRLDYIDGRALTPASYDPFGYRGSWLRN
jgi:hypothetical protein